VRARTEVVPETERQVPAEFDWVPVETEAVGIFEHLWIPIRRAIGGHDIGSVIYHHTGQLLFPHRSAIQAENRRIQSQR